MFVMDSCGEYYKLYVIAINASYIRAAQPRFRKCPVNEVECGLLRFHLFLNDPSTECDHALFQKLNE